MWQQTEAEFLDSLHVDRQAADLHVDRQDLHVDRQDLHVDPQPADLHVDPPPNLPILKSNLLNNHNQLE